LRKGNRPSVQGLRGGACNPIAAEGAGWPPVPVHGPARVGGGQGTDQGRDRHRTFLRMSNRGFLYRRLYKIPWYFGQRRGPRCTAACPVLRGPGFEGLLDE
jgi:hypothetical protein